MTIPATRNVATRSSVQRLAGDPGEGAPLGAARDPPSSETRRLAADDTFPRASMSVIDGIAAGLGR